MASVWGRSHTLQSKNWWNLAVFLNTLLTGKLSESNSPRADLLKQSYAQDIIYRVSNGKIKTPKGILLPPCIKSFTNCTKLINIVCKYGHWISFTVLDRICNQLDTGCPDWSKLCFRSRRISTNTAIITVWDNIDQPEETLTGAGTSHRCNAVGVQPQSAQTHDTKTTEPKTKRCKRSLPMSALDELEQYHTVKKQSPGHLTFRENCSSVLSHYLEQYSL